MLQIVAQFVEGADLSSELIAWKGSGSFSHVDIVLEDGRLLGSRSDVIGGADAGVQIRWPNYEAWKRVARISIEVTHAQYDAFYKFAYSKIGEQYNSAGIVGLVLGNDITNPHDLFCSQFLIESVSASGIFSHPLAVPSNQIDPNCAYAILSTYGIVTVIQ